jgi:hypothetical protein
MSALRWRVPVSALERVLASALWRCRLLWHLDRRLSARERSGPKGDDILGRHHTPYGPPKSINIVHVICSHRLLCMSNAYTGERVRAQAGEGEGGGGGGVATGGIMLARRQLQLERPQRLVAAAPSGSSVAQAPRPVVGRRYQYLPPECDTAC